jgi:hypothetical protein
MTEEEITRRRWILRLGETVAITGMGGIDLLADQEPKLPPGLYGPSLNHLAHVLKPPSPAESGPFTPRFFNADDYKVIERLVSLILGQSEAPVPEVAQWVDLVASQGAQVQHAARSLSAANRRLAIDYFGEEAVRELEDTDAPSLCRTGLEKLGHASFLQLEESAQLSRMNAMEAEKDAFFQWMKGRVIQGFYTSREGLKELDYKGNSFYSESPGCAHQNSETSS